VLATIAQEFPMSDTAVPSDSPLKTDITKLKTNTDLINALIQLAEIEKNSNVIANSLASRDAAAVQALYDVLNGVWFNSQTYETLTADATAFAASRDGSLQIINFLKTNVVTPLLNGYNTLLSAALFYESQADQKLFSTHTFFKGVSSKVTETMETIPPSGGVMGVYASVDRERGVWKAPANVSLSAVIGPAVKIDSKDQEDLNVHTTGKSINAIRAFTGKGTLVWGARTLAGNDNEWRYVPVRRFFNMVEKSVKEATEPFVFEPNDANTWTKVRAMIENFLTLQWRAGALMGAKKEDSFFVHVGLGETMTGDDVLNGKMIVEIGMAVVRPAEFIILRFSHKMMEQ
jgi:uncharacterized protein